ncbi:MAG TPA: amidohydrolase family protein [Dermatophilaceae bacterium]|nr:amidohydrolase family protein [Dermatophilaceae bacterium]
MDAVLSAAAVVTPRRVLRPGWVRVAGGRIAQVGEGAPGPTGMPSALVTELGATVLVPGFVDMHCHGGGGASFGSESKASLAAARAHRRHGTTTLLASLVSAPRERLLREVAALGELVADGELAGIHLEGPWLSPARCGAHDPAQLRPPTREELDGLLASPHVRMVTLAPELDGGLDAVARIAGAGAVAAVGHTDADGATVMAAVDAGARQATHLFNAMRPLRHRDPGPVPALLSRPEVVLELIVDGVHLDPAIPAWLAATVEPGRVVAVTDAMAGAARGDGRYRLGGLEVTVSGGVARVAGTTTIAGSTATADALFRGVAGRAPSDADLLRAVAWTAGTPSRALGRDDVGALAPGRRADLVALDAGTLSVRRAWRGGEPVDPA